MKNEIFPRIFLSVLFYKTIVIIAFNVKGFYAFKLNVIIKYLFGFVYGCLLFFLFVGRRHRTNPQHIETIELQQVENTPKLNSIIELEMSINNDNIIWFGYFYCLVQHNIDWYMCYRNVNSPSWTSWTYQKHCFYTYLTEFERSRESREMDQIQLRVGIGIEYNIKN